MNAWLPITSTATSVVPMPRLLVILDGFGVNLARCAVHRKFEHVQDVALVDLGAPAFTGKVVLHHVPFALHLVVHRAHGDRARDLAGRVPPHAVANDEQRELFVDQVVVLVVVALPADVGAGGDLDALDAAHPHRE